MLEGKHLESSRPALERVLHSFQCSSAVDSDSQHVNILQPLENKHTSYLVRRLLFYERILSSNGIQNPTLPVNKPILLLRRIHPSLSNLRK